MLRAIVNSGRSIEQGTCSKMLVTDEKSVNRVEKTLKTRAGLSRIVPKFANTKTNNDVNIYEVTLCSKANTRRLKSR